MQKVEYIIGTILAMLAGIGVIQVDPRMFEEPISFWRYWRW